MLLLVWFINQKKEIIDISITTYEFLPLIKNICKYLDSGECFGKAGAIMVEGFCKPYIKMLLDLKAQPWDYVLRN